VAALTGLPQLYPDSPAFYGQMALMPVPGNARELHKRLWEEFRVEIPGIVWKGRHFLRASCQFYTTRADIDRLLACLKIIWNK
jgi:selenocysteine lyase/cysteine desulfurase